MNDFLLKKKLIDINSIQYRIQNHLENNIGILSTIEIFLALIKDLEIDRL